ncbi:O-methyltransferase [Salicibibacter cibarius]|uniref:O-methyltransferase n=1 Tax=Salicibibacter cibarius TaxID=2743000 RepID=A0A7T7CB89_9BACI|nr:O-methyltransferase [Salicibibacter cibarius]QQK75692.1 O-methyltransferase [Salicibibacter cibarius]
MNAYLERLRKQNKLPELGEMRLYAKKENIPILEEESMQLLLQVLALTNAERVLEIGSAIGYSALRMASDGSRRKITTVEKDRKRYEEARFFLTRSSYRQSITLLNGDAFDYEEDIAKGRPYDALFVDAAKSHNQSFIETFSPHVKRGGVIVVDNVLFKGWVANPLEAPKRLQKLARNINAFNEWFQNHPGFATKIHAVGDGLAVGIKR